MRGKKKSPKLVPHLNPYDRGGYAAMHSAELVEDTVLDIGERAKRVIEASQNFRFNRDKTAAVTARLAVGTYQDLPVTLCVWVEVDRHTTLQKSDEGKLRRNNVMLPRPFYRAATKSVGVLLQQGHGEYESEHDQGSKIKVPTTAEVMNLGVTSCAETNLGSKYNDFTVAAGHVLACVRALEASHFITPPVESEGMGIPTTADLVNFEANLRTDTL